MISATSSLAAGILSDTFGTPASSTPTIPTGGSSSSSSPDYILAESIGGGNADASFLSNLAFAQDTESLLLDPYSNGALTGKPSSYVQQIINAITPGASATAAANTSTQSSATTTSPISPPSDPSSSSDTSATDDSTTSALPADGILA